MKNLRRNFERFCYKHRTKGVPNLMLYITAGSGLVFLFTMITNNPILYDLLRFDRNLILQGQVWRLFSYVFTYGLGYGPGDLLFTFVGLICYYSLGRGMENIWGTCRFNLFYFTGVILMDVFCLLIGGVADITYLNLSLFLAYATLFPDTHFMLFFIIPIKAWIFAVIDLAITFYDVITLTFMGYFPFSLFPLVAIANYFLFFGSDIKNVFPVSWRANAARLFRRKKKYAPTEPKAKTIPFPKAGSYEASNAKVKAPYNHRCTVCGRTDVSNPELEFRYCSKCNGYHCYCEEHISSHTHIE